MWWTYFYQFLLIRIQNWQLCERWLTYTYCVGRMRQHYGLTFLSVAFGCVILHIITNKLPAIKLNVPAIMLVKWYRGRLFTKKCISHCSNQAKNWWCNMKKMPSTFSSNHELYVRQLGTFYLYRFRKWQLKMDFLITIFIAFGRLSIALKTKTKKSSVSRIMLCWYWSFLGIFIGIR